MISPPLVAKSLLGDWSAENFRSRPVSLLGGPAFTGVAIAAAAVSGAPMSPILSATSGALLAGRIDDLWGGDDARGLRSHFRMLRSGRISTGVAKFALLAATGMGTVAAVHRVPDFDSVDSFKDRAAIAGCVALGANLANLFDLRPGRALKVVLAVSLPLGMGDSAGASALTGVATAALACLPADLAESTMLGDAGANPAGALTGLGLALRAGPRARWLLLAGMLALTVASEALSFSRVIADVVPLRWLDELGRSAQG